MTEHTTSTLVSAGLKFPECPRWRGGRLWFADMWGGQVWTVDSGGAATTVIDEVPGTPGGLGWTVKGELLVVSVNHSSVLRLGTDGLSAVVDLAAAGYGRPNDMVVDAAGRVYVGIRTGRDADRNYVPAPVVLVTPDGAVSAVADDMHGANGMVITPDGSTLIVAESLGSRLTAFDIADDGSLSGRRTFAELPGLVPDGICLDAEGAVWVAAAFEPTCVRVRQFGEVLDRVVTQHNAYACMLGGADGGDEQRLAGESIGYIETVEVSVPHAGLP